MVEPYRAVEYEGCFNSGYHEGDPAVSVHARPGGSVWVEDVDVTVIDELTPAAARELAGSLLAAAAWAEGKAGG